MKRRFLKITTAIACLTSIGILQGCAQNNGLSDIGLLPANHAIVFAAPAGKTISTRSNVPEPVVFRFRRDDKTDGPPIYLDLIGAPDQSVKVFAARPGTYRLVEAYLLARPGDSRWSFKEAPNVLEVREGEAVYVGTLNWRDSWVEIDNDESEARAIYRKRQREFEDRSLKFVTRLVQTTKFSR